MEFLEALASWLNQSPWLNLLSMTLGLIGVLLSVIFYFRAKIKVYPRFQTTGISLIAPGAKSVQYLSILHGDRILDMLSVTTVSFWNEGSKVLEWDDVATADPIRIVFPEDTTIIQAKVDHQSSPGNNVRLSISPTEPSILVTFDYLARHEGCTFEIFHDGEEPDCAMLLGTVKGFGHPQEAMESDDPISDTYVYPILKKVWDHTGGPKTVAFWLFSPIWIIPLLFTLFFIDLPLKPFRFFGPSRKFSAYKRIRRYE